MIIVVSLGLIPGVLIDAPCIVLMLIVFSLIAFLKVDVTGAAIGAMVVGVDYAVWGAIQ